MRIELTDAQRDILQELFTQRRNINMEIERALTLIGVDGPVTGGDMTSESPYLTVGDDVPAT